MSKSRIMIYAVAATFTFTLVAAAQSANFNAKTGLWESTVTILSSGMPAMPSIPPDALARMTPEQQARVAAAMKGGMMNGQPHTYKDCLTPEKLAKGFNASAAERPNCKRTVITNTSSVMEMR